MSHNHSHSHHHSHQLSNYNSKFIIGIVLNIIFIGVELYYGKISNSIALVADAGHNFSDVLALLLAWGAFILSQKAKTPHRTYGYKKVSILASLFSSILLLFALGLMASEVYERLNNPIVIQGKFVVITAAIGVVINFVTAMLFFRDRKNDLNIRGAFLHMMADALVSLGAVISGIILIFKPWYWVDSALSIIVIVLILISTLQLFKVALKMSIDGVPENVNYELVKVYLSNLLGVIEIHDLHIWALSTNENALTVHLIMEPMPADPNPLLYEIQEEMHHHFNISHVTVQIESQNLKCHLKDEI